MTALTPQKRLGTSWRDFLAGLAGPSAVWAAESAQGRGEIRRTIERARDHVLELDTSYAIDPSAGNREIDAALDSADARRHQLRRVFDAMAALAGGPSGGRPHAAEFRRLLARAAELAPAATAASEPFKGLAEAVDRLAVPSV